MIHQVPSSFCLFIFLVILSGSLVPRQGCKVHVYRSSSSGRSSFPAVGQCLTPKWPVAKEGNCLPSRPRQCPHPKACAATHTPPRSSQENPIYTSHPPVCPLPFPLTPTTSILPSSSPSPLSGYTAFTSLQTSRVLFNTRSIPSHITLTIARLC